MPKHTIRSACLLIALTCCAVIAGTMWQSTSDYVLAENKPVSIQDKLQTILLTNNQSENFNVYCTNGTAPTVDGDYTLIIGSNKTNVYTDAVSLTSVSPQKILVLEAQIAVNLSQFSDTGEDQFCVFAADDTAKYKGNEIGFVLPEIGSTWYAYIQSTQIQGFFVWNPILTLEPNTSQIHEFKATYSDKGVYRWVDFYVDGRLAWASLYPNVSDRDFQMVLTSHKISSEEVDLSQNQMIVQEAVLSADGGV